MPIFAYVLFFSYVDNDYFSEVLGEGDVAKKNMIDRCAFGFRWLVTQQIRRPDLKMRDNCYFKS